MTALLEWNDSLETGVEAVPGDEARVILPLKSRSLTV